MIKIKNFLTNEYVLIAPSRVNRPHDFKDVNFTHAEVECPFCDYFESEIDGVLYESEDKTCLIVKNKYPAVDGIDSSHEVVIDGKDHEMSFHDINIEYMAKVFKGIIEREKILLSGEKIETVQVYKNNGAKAGASLMHSHMQIVALDYVPVRLQTISNNMSKYRTDSGNCYICSLTEGEEIFTFHENETFRATTKFDTTMSNTVDIFPKRHIRNFSDFSDEDIIGLCDALKVSIKAISKAIDSVNYNILFYSSPMIKNKLNDDFHFYVQIVPRVYGFAGFELATGCFINSVDPKKYCEKLKKAIN